MKNTLIQIEHCHNMVIALYRDENNVVRAKKYIKTTTDSEVRADILGVIPTEAEAEEKPQETTSNPDPVSLSFPVNTARSAKEEQAIKRTQYLAELNRLGVHEFDNERSFAKIEAAYQKHTAKKVKK